MRSVAVRPCDISVVGLSPFFPILLYEWRVFIPDDLKPNRRVEPSEPLMRSWLLLATADVEQLLRICVKLLQEAGQRFPERN